LKSPLTALQPRTHAYVCVQCGPEHDVMEVKGVLTCVCCLRCTAGADSKEAVAERVAIEKEELISVRHLLWCCFGRATLVTRGTFRHQEPFATIKRNVSRDPSCWSKRCRLGGEQKNNPLSITITVHGSRSSMQTIKAFNPSPPIFLSAGLQFRHAVGSSTVCLTIHEKISIEMCRAAHLR